MIDDLGLFLVKFLDNKFAQVMPKRKEIRTTIINTVLLENFNFM
jgi:hypothetical protein